MKDQETMQKFIELRSQGWTYARLMAELSLSKPTLVNWSRKFQFQIQNLGAIELEALANKWLTPVTDRVNGLGVQLQKVEGELAGREVKELSTTSSTAWLANCAASSRKPRARSASPPPSPKFPATNSTSRSTTGRAELR